MLYRDPKCVFVANNVGQADIVAGWLQEHGFPAEVMNRETMGAIVALSSYMTGVEVWVVDPAQAPEASGGMGRVLAAHDLSLDRDVALKILLPGANADRFVRESKITGRLPHPGIPPVYALGTLADGSPFLAMKLIAGRTLADELKTADRPQLLQAFTQVCQAVGLAHSRGVIHRDLKPANVMVGAFGEVQVMDWGLAMDLTSGEVPYQPRSPLLPPRPQRRHGRHPDHQYRPARRIA